MSDPEQEVVEHKVRRAVSNSALLLAYLMGVV